MSALEIIGRGSEKAILRKLTDSSKPELLAVYGRRRVGKTYLVQRYFGKAIDFDMTGKHNASLSEQLENFTAALSRASPRTYIAVPRSWTEAFRMLEAYLEQITSKKKKIVFLDEFPWMSTARSGFLSAFTHFWNTYGTRQSNLLVIICGSSASWMIQHVVKNKGGLHNRITRRIRLQPFNLHETKKFLTAKHVNLNNYLIAQVYMVLGGIPHYLNAIEPGLSVAQNIDNICFQKDGLLREEYNNLYPALFDRSERHIEIIAALNSKKSGLSRKEILNITGQKSGGWMTKVLDELIESGFISRHQPFNKKIKDSLYRLSDPFTLFYLNFMKNNRTHGKGVWLKKSARPGWRSWVGLAFENVCLAHIAEIKKSLDIAAVYSEESSWLHRGTKDEQGAQIDLLIDRDDQIINICEIKFTENSFSITKAYARDLENKLSVFKENTKTKKTIFMTLLTSHGMKENDYSRNLIQSQVTLKDLFIDIS